MDLTKDDVLKIIAIVENSGYDEVRLEIGEFKLHVQKHALGAPMAAASGQLEQPVAPRPAAGHFPPDGTLHVEQPVPEGVVAVRAPMLGIFYRAPAPGEKPFVEVGSKVGVEDTVCLVEVMKLFNSVKAGVAGTVVRILAENATMVEHGQMLMLVAPDPGGV
jgi:acetyl-CoA carboxylase biotin carboxyl carrier protein